MRMRHRRKCPHGRFRYDCRECNGKGICVHQVRYRSCLRCHVAQLEPKTEISEPLSARPLSQDCTRCLEPKTEISEPLSARPLSQDCTRCLGTPNSDGCMKCLGYLVVRGHMSSDWRAACFDGGEERSVFTGNAGEHWFANANRDGGELDALLATSIMHRVKHAGRVQRMMSSTGTPDFIKRSAEVVASQLLTEQELPLHVRMPSLLFTRPFALEGMPHQAAHRDTFPDQYGRDESYQFYSVFLALDTFSIAVQGGSHRNSPDHSNECEWTTIRVEQGNILVIHGTKRPRNVKTSFYIHILTLCVFDCSGLIVHYGMTQEGRRIHYFLCTDSRQSLASTNFDVSVLRD